MTAQPELVGKTIGGRYQLLELLGVGGMGAVYRGYDRELDELVAFKVIHSALTNVPAITASFRQEVKLARRVTHPNVARTFELGHADGVTFCTMELIEGESLRDRLRRGSLPVTDACSIIGDVCDGLAAAHAVGVIHRDIKPENILLARDGRVVLADFGVAAIPFADTNMEISGTPAYMAPEQARGEPPAPATDVYALGVVLYETLTTLPAFTGTTLAILDAKQQVGCVRVDVPHVPRALAFVIERATAGSRMDRIASIAELRRLLEPWIEPSEPRRPKRAGITPPQELCTIVVVAPRVDGPDRKVHIAEGIHESILQGLVQLPGFRVLPRATAAAAPGAVVVELLVADRLTVTIRPRWRPAITSSFPLDVTAVTTTAASVIAAVADAARHDDPEFALAADAEDLLLQGRSLAHRVFQGGGESFQLLERARALRAEDPRIAASLAMLHASYAVLSIDGEQLIPRANELTRAALAIAPDLAGSHIAAGQLELYLGQSARAAVHFRTAITCSPYMSDGHESLGRLLLEAGFLDLGLARLDEALAIAPRLVSARWEIAKARALEQDWAAHDELVARLQADSDRQLHRLRFALWRGEPGRFQRSAERGDVAEAFDPKLFEGIVAVLAGGSWLAYKPVLIELARAMPAINRRRHAFVMQLVAEIAGHAGDAATCIEMLEGADDAGLFDLHWLDRCPVLEVARPTVAFAAIRAHVSRRANAILDALYGDHEESSLSDTIVG